MKINFAEISKLYQDNLDRGGSVAKDSCPDPERLVNSIMTEVPRKEKAEILRHAANCPACAGALKGLLCISAEVTKLAEQVEILSKSGRGCASPEKKTFWAWIVKKPLAATLMGLAAMAVIAVYVTQPRNKSAKRSEPGVGIQMISPVKTSLPEATVQFKWESLANADYYIVELFDKTLKLVWRSGLLYGNETPLAGGVSKDMIPGETYYWTVTAVMTDHIEIKSRMAEFSIRK
jgi:hypothetical protein